MKHHNDILLYLASQSPRRRALLKELGFKVEIIKAPDIEEVFPENLRGSEIPVYLSKLKAQAYTERLPENVVLVTADTIVWLNNEVLGKPKDTEDAILMLQKLSGNMHEVFTGVSLKYRNHQVSFFDTTKVYFRELTTDEIRYYVETYHPLDKAGSYGVQEWIGYTGVSHIEGSYFNVMGLPTFKLYEELSKIIELS